MKTLDDILADFSFHDSTLKKIHYENDKKDLILDVDLPKRDFSDTKLNCIIKYENINLKELTLDITKIDWNNVYGSVLNYSSNFRDVFYFIELVNSIKHTTEYLKIAFSSSGYKIKIMNLNNE
jgi:hypothetical protein